MVLWFKIRYTLEKIILSKFYNVNYNFSCTLKNKKKLNKLAKIEPKIAKKKKKNKEGKDKTVTSFEEFHIE